MREELLNFSSLIIWLLAVITVAVASIRAAKEEKIYFMTGGKGLIHIFEGGADVGGGDGSSVGGYSNSSDMDSVGSIPVLTQ